MARKMTLPKIGVNMTEAVIAKWLVSEGDTISDGDPIIEAETDKSTQEIYATEGGIVAKLLVEEGETVECYADIMVLVESGETYVESEEPQKEEIKEPQKEVEKVVVKEVQKTEVTTVNEGSKRIRISPLAKKVAKEKGINYANVSPATPLARIVLKDVLKYIERSANVSTDENLEVLKMSATRKVIAARMTQSTQEKPCVGLTTTVDATAILNLRKKYKEKGIKISFDAILAKIAGKALTMHRDINTILEGDTLYVKRNVNVGVAVDTKKGLMVPVVSDADKKNLVEISQNLSSLVEKAQEGNLSAQDMSGATFTITNLGMFGVEEFAPIINPPECCILGVGALKKEFVPDEEDKPMLITTFKLTLVFDHRIVDGAPAARFLQTLKEFAQMPELLI